MASLKAYLKRTGTSQKALAERADVSQSMLNQINSGGRRPSPEAAKRIELATGGEVRAAVLLGLEEGGGAFDHELVPRSLNDGRWAARVANDGSLHLSPEMLQALGFAAGERLLFTPEQGGVRLHSTDRVLERIQQELQGLVPEGVSLADDLIAERRIESRRE